MEDNLDNNENLKYRGSKTKSVDFKPNDILHISMHSDDETIPLKWNSDNNIDRYENHTDINVGNHIDSTVPALLNHNQAQT